MDIRRLKRTLFEAADFPTLFREAHEWLFAKDDDIETGHTTILDITVTSDFYDHSVSLCIYWK